jgi:hypothetical protein
VAYAADHRFSVDVDRMREDEGRLFGAAADAADSNRSRVRIRLDRWESGNPALVATEVRKPERARAKCGSDWHLGTDR